MGGVPSGGNTFKNVLIGIGTTVAAYAIVSFLGIGKGGKTDSNKVKKEATVNAWKSVSDYINYANEKFKTIACYSCDLQEMKQELLRELDNNSNSLRNLKDDKNIDDKMVSVIDRTIQQFMDLKPLYSEYYDSLTVIQNMPPESLATISAEIQGRYLKRIAHVQTRDTSEIRLFLRDVNKKYKTDLKQEPPGNTIEPEALVRKWRIECLFDMEFKEDGKIIWTENENVFPGRWNLYGAHLEIKLDNGQKFNLNVISLSPKIFVYYNPEYKTLMGACPK